MKLTKPARLFVLTMLVGALTCAQAGSVRIAAGREHSLRADTNGVLTVSGANAFGQLGDGTTTGTTTATVVSLPYAGVIDVAAGEHHSLLLTSERVLWGMGRSNRGQLGSGTTTSRLVPNYLTTDVAGMAAGIAHSAILKIDGTLWTTGGNDQGQLGDGTVVDRLMPVRIATGVVDFAAGGRQTLFITADGKLWGTGNLYGNGMTTSTPMELATGVKSVAAGSSHSIFLKTDGTLWAVGANTCGQLGNNSTTAATNPVQVATNVKAVAAGYDHSLFIKADKSLWAFGRNDSGQIGNFTTDNQLVPYQLATGVVAVSASESYTLFTKDDASLWATGFNGNGQFGNGNANSTTSPIQVASGTSVLVGVPTELTAGAYLPADRLHLSWKPVIGAVTYEVWRGSVDDVTLASRIAENVRWPVYQDLTVGSGGTYYYWVRAIGATGAGEFSAGALGDFTPLTPPQIFVQPIDAEFVIGWNSSAFFTVGATGSGPLHYQWRRNGVNILGSYLELILINPQEADDGEYDVVISNLAGSVVSESASLVRITPTGIGASPVNQSVVAGGSATFTVTPSGTGPFTYRWQRQVSGSVWNDLVEGGIFSGVFTATLTVAPVEGSMAGDLYRCRVSGRWGSATSDYARLFLVTNAGGIKVSAGDVRGLFLRSDGTLWGVGLLGFDPAGGGNTWVRNAPIQIASSVTEVAAGSGHVLMLKTDGSLWAMGQNEQGQLCDGTTTARTSPVQVQTGVVAIAAGERRSYFIKVDGSLWSAGGGFAAPPALVTTHVRAVAVSSSSMGHVLIIKSDGSLWGRGDGSRGQLGLGTSNPSSQNFVQLATGVRSIAAGEYHSLFIKEDGSLWGMGSNESGELGDGSGTSRFTPVMITTGVRTALAGYRRSFFIKDNDQLWAMGYNDGGVLGDGSTVNRLAPVLIDSNVAGIATGAALSLLVKKDGSVWSTGMNNYGQLGVGDTVNRVTPVQIAAGTVVAPAAPTGLVGSNGTTYTGVHLNWNAVLGATSYDVYRHTADVSASATLLASRVGSAYYEDTTAVPGQTYYYWVRAGNPAGTSALSAGANGMKAVAVLPVITTQPAGQTVNAQGTRAAAFSVTATGTDPLVYQWRRNGLNLGDSFYVHGANTANLSFNDLSTVDGGTITVVVSNPAGAVESAPAELAIGNPPSVYQQPEAQVVRVGDTATFSVSMITDFYSPAPAFVWKRNGVALPNSNSATLTIASVQVAHAGSYTLEATNVFGTATSTPATLTVAAPQLGADLNGDGKTDLLWRNTSNNDYAAWLMNGTTMSGSASYGLPAEWRVIKAADFDGDGNSDLVWRNSATGAVVLWQMNGTTIGTSTWIYDSGTDWTAEIFADFNGDGKMDILWHNTVNGQHAFWLMNGGTVASASGFSIAAGWSVAKAADFNGDGKTDLLWRNASSGGVVMWLQNGTTTTSSAWIYDSGTDWAFQLFADFNGDGKTDILWHNPVTGEYAFWLMDGSTVASASGFSIAAGWSVTNAADFSGDGKADLIWRNSTSGGMVMWIQNGAVTTSTAWIYDSGIDWEIKATNDFNSDGEADILWHNTATGDYAFWLMNGSTTASASGFSLPAGWEPVE